MALQKRAVDPGERAGRANGVRAFRQELAARGRWPNTIKIPGKTAVRGMHDPLGEIPHVDELDRIIRRSRHKHLAASIEPRRPIGEPPRWVLWTCDQSGPANKGVPTYRLLTRDLGGAIGLLGAVLHLQCCGRPEWSGICPLPGGAVVGIYAHRRYKGPMLDALPECRDCATHLAGMTRHINDGVELLAGKWREAVRFVAVHSDEASAVRNRSGDASCGARHVMAHRVGVCGNCAPEKLRAAKDQQAHSYTPRPICSSNVISSHQLYCYNSEPRRTSRIASHSQSSQRPCP